MWFVFRYSVLQPRSRGVGIMEIFIFAFIDRFFNLMLRELKIQGFINLHHGGMSVKSML